MQNQWSKICGYQNIRNFTVTFFIINTILDSYQIGLNKILTITINF